MTNENRRTVRVPLRVIRMECCGHLLCWVNPRFPSYCPECGIRCYPGVQGWVMQSDMTAMLKADLKQP